jgi:aryl-alcohol dehydrogenase-like predicted oxidoreductase
MTKAVKTAFELGINFFDTAEGYGFGIGQRQLGVALKELNIPRE